MRRVSAICVAAAAALAAVAAVPPASAACGPPAGTDRLLRAVTVDGIMKHARALQAIADANGGNRALGHPGLAATIDYVKKTMTAAGYKVTEQPFTAPVSQETAPPVLARTGPGAATYPAVTVAFSISGDVTGTVVPTKNIVVPPTPEPSSTSGCDAGDFPPASKTVPQVALIERGGCFFQTKVANAEAAGYSAAILFNSGQPGNEGVLPAAVSAPTTIPVVATDYASGAALYTASQSGPVSARVDVHNEIIQAPTANLVMETPGGDPDHVLLVNAQLDSVPDGPGINDDGTGTATVMTIAEQIAKLKLHPAQKIRFAFFGDEEATTFRSDGQNLGLLGADHYVNSLTTAEKHKIFANLYFDMLASPNYVRFVFDGDGKATGVHMPKGSGIIQQDFIDYFNHRHLATEPIEPTPWDGGTDFGPLVDAGIPTGGVFGGDMRRDKTAEEAAVYGGTAGETFDPCYHQACDTASDLNLKGLEELGHAATALVWQLGKSRNPLGAW